MTVEQLIKRFVAIGLDQDKAIFNDENARFNRLYDEMAEIRNELKSRSGDQRSALVSLLDHPNLQVRLKTAITTMAVAPAQSRRALQTIADSSRLPHAADAGLILSGLDDGSYVPS